MEGKKEDQRTGKDKQGSRPQRPEGLPKGGEEERRGNEDPTYPDLMGPYPDQASTRGAVLSEEDRSSQGENNATEKEDPKNS